LLQKNYVQEQGADFEQMFCIDCTQPYTVH